jgi:uncharacterized protein
MATGNGLARATHGCPGIGLSAHARPRSGLKVTGCDDQAGGSGWRVTGSKRIPPDPDDAFLLLDYPGYGKCQGYASIASTRASTDAALNTLAKRLALSEDEMESRLCAIGHSLGSAVAIDFARRHRVQRVVAIAPFTTLREEAARVITGPLSYLLIENYDNRAGIVEIRQRNPEAKIAIFHGTKDEVIPVRMGRELAQNFPFIDFFPVEDANHVSVLFEAHDKIIRWMNN